MTHVPNEARRQMLAALAAVAGAASASCSDSKHAAGDGKNAVQASASDPVRIQPDAYRVLLDNEHVRVLEFISRPGAGMCGVGRHTHPRHLTVALSDASVRVTLPDGQSMTVANKLGDVMWSEAETHSTENVGGDSARALIVELKGASAAARS